MNETQNNLLICMMGFPRSGKTTQAQALGHPIVSPDAIRLALHGQPFYAPAEPVVWTTAELMVRSLFLAGHRTVILDACNNTRKRRDQWRSKDWLTVFYHVKEEPQVCIERAKAGGRDYLIDVITRMVREHEPLQEDELRWQ